MNERILLVVIVLAFGGGMTAAAPDAQRTYRNEVKQARRSEKGFWEGFKRAYNRAYLAFRQPLENARTDPVTFKEAVQDFSKFDEIYGEYAAIEAARGNAAITWAMSGGPRALPSLFKEMLALAPKIDRLDRELLEARPSDSRFAFDQRPGVLRHGLHVLEKKLVEALGAAHGAAAFLAGDGWESASRKDGRKSIRRRVAVIDALGALPRPARDEAARKRLASLITAPASSLRVAAVEALARWGADEAPLLHDALADPSPIVRRVALEAARGPAKNPSWISPVLDGSTHPARARSRDHLVTLETLTRQKFGYDAAAWREWFGEYRKEIESGKFKVEETEVQDVKPRPATDEIRFFGVPTLGRGIVFIVDGGVVLEIPTDVKYKRSRYFYEWYGWNPSWKKQYPSQQMVLLDQLGLTFSNWTPESRFGLIILHQNFNLTILGEKKLLGSRRADFKAAHDKIDKLRAAPRRWCSQYAGILGAMSIGGLDPGSDTHFKNPKIDTIYLWNRGLPRGGRYMSAAAVVSAFKRLNRFRRVVVHSIRVGDAKEAAEQVMKGIADASGGTYVWVQKAPK
ncbi:MAG: HEAT repeat domain-containing protein [Planctomycetota bacterium]|nr:HEAT repeat domain-containing protein [Planctomycetota bacterium]